MQQPRSHARIANNYNATVVHNPTSSSVAEMRHSVQLQPNKVAGSGLLQISQPSKQDALRKSQQTLDLPLHPGAKSNQQNSNKKTNSFQKQNFHSFNEQQTDMQLKSGALNEYSDKFNANTATYSQSLQFYETQYREKLREIDAERRFRKDMEERVQELEAQLRDIVEENAKLKEDLKEVVGDNALLTQHFTQMQEQLKA